MLLLRKIWYGFKVLFVSFQQPGFAIRRGYLHRKSVTDFIDQGNTDEYQKEVYVFARNFYDEKGLEGVLDIGCGSAFKLLANFDNVPKAGAELSTDWLKQKYPSEIWFTFSDKEWKQFSAFCCRPYNALAHRCIPQQPKCTGRSVLSGCHDW